MEASTGIEPVYTDLQSNQPSKDNNGLGSKKYQDKGKTKSEPDTRRKPSLLSKHIKPDHKRMSRMIGYTLTLGDADAWAGFVAVATARMTPEERAALAFPALRSLDTPEQAELVAEAVLKFADYPLPTFLNPMDDARWWASFASLKERKAYALAAYEALPPHEQMAFRKHISEVEIAI